MYVTISDLAGFGLGQSYNDLKALASQVLQAAQSAPPSAQSQVQAIMNRSTGFSTPGFGTVSGLANQLQSFNPPASFYAQDQQVLNQALTDINNAIQGGGAAQSSAMPASSNPQISDMRNLVSQVQNAPGVQAHMNDRGPGNYPLSVILNYWSQTGSTSQPDFMANYNFLTQLLSQLNAAQPAAAQPVAMPVAQPVPMAQPVVGTATPAMPVAQQFGSGLPPVPGDPQFASGPSPMPASQPSVPTFTPAARTPQAPVAPQPSDGGMIMGVPTNYVLIGVGGLALIGLAAFFLKGEKRRPAAPPQYPGYPPMMGGYPQPAPQWGYQQPQYAPPPPQYAYAPAPVAPPLKANKGKRIKAERRRCECECDCTARGRTGRAGFEGDALCKDCHADLRASQVKLAKAMGQPLD